MSIIYKGSKKILGGGIGSVSTANNATNLNGLTSNRFLVYKGSASSYSLDNMPTGIYSTTGSWWQKQLGISTTKGPLSMHGWGFLIVLSNNGDWWSQIYLPDFNPTTTGVSTPGICFRDNIGASWTSWRKFTPTS